jgi:hypothetical protein
MREKYTPATRQREQKVNPTDFEHVTNRMLQHVLKADPKHIKPVEMRQALNWTLDALGRDVINWEIPPDALEQRIDAARSANTAITEGQRALCQGALRRFWGI